MVSSFYQQHPPIRVLLASNDRNTADLVHSAVSLLHDECVVVADGQGALGELNAGGFQVVLAETRLPDMSGLELLQHLHGENHEAGFVLVCGCRDQEQAIEATRLGASGCLSRPLRKERIVAAVQRALQHHRHETEQRLFHRALEESTEGRTSHLFAALQQAESSQRSALEALVVALDGREHMTHLHSLRVQAYTLALGERCGYDLGRMLELSYGALLHDIGKIVIPDSILLKPGPLTPEEQRTMQQHPVRGYQLLSRIADFQQAGLIALYHHERIDGKGYPLGLAGEEIPLEARIFTVADALDVILSGRPYCAPRSLAAARAELLRCAGTQFDRDVVDVFLQVSDEEWRHIQESVAVELAPDTPLPTAVGTPF